MIETTFKHRHIQNRFPYFFLLTTSRAVLFGRIELMTVTRAVHFGSIILLCVGIVFGQFVTPITFPFCAFIFSFAAVVVRNITAVEATFAVAVAVTKGAAFVAIAAVFAAIGVMVVAAVVVFTICNSVAVAIAHVLAIGTVVVFINCRKDAEPVAVEEATVCHFLHSIRVDSSVVGIVCVAGVTGVVGVGKVSNNR